MPSFLHETLWSAVSEGETTVSGASILQYLAENGTRAFYSMPDATAKQVYEKLLQVPRDAILVKQDFSRILQSCRHTQYDNLFVFEMANNHQGDLEHGLQIIRNCGDLAKRYGLNAGVKLQFRDYDTFVHPDYLPGGVHDGANKHVGRFLSTKLSDEEFQILGKEIQRLGMHFICTPFDEASVNKCVSMGVNIVKIGSPSLHDFRLMEKVASTRLPVIVSSGGCSIDHVDKLVSFFDNRFVPFSLMHCVSIYPTPDEQLCLSTISQFRKRYPHITIGFSTHEPPENTEAIQVAYACGARMFEKHVGHATEKYKLNAYSTNMQETEKWVQAYTRAVAMCGTTRVPTDKERNDLQMLNRGVYLRRDIREGETISESDIYFAFPIAPNGVVTSDFTAGCKALRAQEKDTPIMKDDYPRVCSKEQLIAAAIHKIKALLRESSVVLPHDCDMEISHHYGMEKFAEVGCFIATCFNFDEYAKKILVVLAGQRHPTHFHRVKDETFFLLSGDCQLQVCSQTFSMEPGNYVRVPRNTPHCFYSAGGCVIEEVSTTAVLGDSEYLDCHIVKDRKTPLYNWKTKNYEKL